MARLVFEKTGNAAWISHLDLMRLFQRAFKRADLPLKHTQGFNPRPAVSIALPLSVGVESVCELLDFELVGELPSTDEIQSRLNAALVPGVQVLAVSYGGRKIKELSLLECQVVLEYDREAGERVAEEIRQLFTRSELLVAKKSKNGPVEQDIIPMIRRISVTAEGAHRVVINACICCQNPSMNPIQLAGAVSRYLPDHTPDHVLYRRMEIYDAEEKIFR